MSDKIDAAKVTQECHILTKKAGSFFIVIPLKGGFFTDPDKLKLKIANKDLTLDDYVALSIVPNSYEKFQGEVGDVILIKGFDEGDVVSIDYQIHEASEHVNSSLLMDLITEGLKDNRPVDFKKHLINVPKEFSPNFHSHFMSETVGWGEVIIGIERLINVLTLQKVPAFEALVDWVKATQLEVAGREDIISMKAKEKVIDLAGLLLASQSMNFASVFASVKSPLIKAGDSIHLEVQTSGLESLNGLYWKINHKETFPDMFTINESKFDLNDQVFRQSIVTKQMSEVSGSFAFFISIHKGSPEGPIITKTETLTISFGEVKEIISGSF